MGHEKTARVVALQAEVDRLNARLQEESARYTTAYYAWRLSGYGEDELKYGYEIVNRYNQLKLDLRKAYDLLAEAQAELEES